MIIQETVLVTLHGNNIDFYEKLGYSISRYINKLGKLKVKRKTQIKVKVSDLPKNSNVKVFAKCDNPFCTSQPKLVIFQSLIRRKDGKYYCHKCSMNNIETKTKMIESGKRKIFSKEHLENLSKSSWIKGKFGKNSPMWNTDKTNEERRKQHSIPGINHWRKLIYKRDNKICVCCGSNKSVCAHHKDNFLDFKELRLSVDNGVCLCLNCHRKFHNLYGIKHTTKEMFENFMKFSNLQTYQDEFSSPKILEDFGSSVT